MCPILSQSLPPSDVLWNRDRKQTLSLIKTSTRENRHSGRIELSAKSLKLLDFLLIVEELGRLRSIVQTNPSKLSAYEWRFF